MDLNDSAKDALVIFAIRASIDVLRIDSRGELHRFIVKVLSVAQEEGHVEIIAHLLADILTLIRDPEILSELYAQMTREFVGPPENDEPIK